MLYVVATVGGAGTGNTGIVFENIDAGVGVGVVDSDGRGRTGNVSDVVGDGVVVPNVGVVVPDINLVVVPLVIAGVVAVVLAKVVGGVLIVVDVTPAISVVEVLGLKMHVLVAESKIRLFGHLTFIQANLLF